MEEIIIKKWYPIIEKLDTTSSLEEADRYLLCKYCEDFSKIIISTTSSIDELYSLKKSEPNFNENLLPVMLLILYKLIPKLKELNIPYSFDSTSHTEQPEIEFIDNKVSIKSKSQFNTHIVQLKIDRDVYDNLFHKTGIDLIDKCGNALRQICIDTLFEHAILNNELVLKVGYNSIGLMSDPILNHVMYLTYQIKENKK